MNVRRAKIQKLHLSNYRQLMIKTLLIVALGGGIGSIARFLLQRGLSNGQAGVFPTGTLVVNLTGCLLIGIIWGFSERHNSLNAEWKLFLLTGLCGGFTTFSAYSYESISLLREEKFNLFFSYVGATLLLGFLLTWLGYSLTK